ncbi:STAS domain-containing protein [Streptomyces sp. NPDC047097]|uniref:STAS domain-containing protein n=1 Tax=Streptomyces sp. NPDC047097 TaxID=3155260 RepID=UPI0033F65BE5
MGTELRIDVLAGIRPVLARMHGELDLHTCPEVIAALAPLSGTQVELDLEPLSFLDSSGIGTLLALRTAALRAGGGLRVIACSPLVGRTLDLAGCRHVLTGP